jgi:histidinol-phosphate/aromatic aminotransferase/cobyric acid decarboxylase-like protein
MMQLHGGITSDTVEAHGLNPYDFSANINPWGCSPLVAEALARIKPHYYPDPDCRGLRDVIATHEGVSPGEVLCGNGAVELIWGVCRWASTHAQPVNPSICIAEPTFSQYATAAERCGLIVHRYRTSEESKFQISADGYAAFVADNKPRLTFVCSPNNPTGQVFDQRPIDQLVSVNPHGYVIVDQAYREYVNAAPVANSGRVLRICSLTKAYGLAGLRLGYMVGDAELLESIRAQMPPWSVNAAAQAAGIAALTDQEWLRNTLALRRKSAETLRQLLTAAGFDIACEGAGFFLVRVGDASQWRQRLFDRGFAVRDCTSFGLPDYIRISAGPEDACRKLTAAMVEVRAELC